MLQLPVKPEPSVEMRERFEKLAIDKKWDIERNPNICETRPWDYQDPITQTRWNWWQIAWQAGAASQGEGWVSADEPPAERTWVIAVTEHDGKRQTVPMFRSMHRNKWRWESEFKVVLWRPLPAAPPKEAKQ